MHMMRALSAWLVFLALLATMLGFQTSPASALKAISISADQDRLEITMLGQLYEGRGDSLQIETAADLDGSTGRMSVRATTPGTNPSWIVFALTNPTDTPIERWLTADRYTLIGSGAVWPDLDARRIEAVTPSIGFVPQRIESNRADVFSITIEPGQTITYVAELSSERYARIYLWKPLDYELKVRERQLFNGVMLGLTGLLAIFLTAIFAANHKVIFPAAALVAWCVLGYLCVDFGFFHKLFQLKAENNAVYRAATESAMAASLVIFLYFFLRIPLWHGLARMLFGVWIIAQLALVALAVIDPRLASTFARLSFLAIGGIGGLVIMFLAFRGQDRALALIPTWMLLLVWIFGTGVTLTGQLSGDMIGSGLVAGLVLLVLLIGFTVTQFAFRSLEPLYGAAPSELQLRSVAVDAAGATIWEWSARRDEVKVSGPIEAALGLNPGELSTKTDDFCRHIHSADRERFRLSLLSAQERDDTRLKTCFRLRHADNSYIWYELEAASVPSSDGRTVKCIGLLRDVSDTKRSQERLLHNAVRCSLTGLPNLELFADRLTVAMHRTKSEPGIHPTVMIVDIDKFKSVNASFGVVVGDSLLLTVARRLQRHIEEGDTLARVGGDRFALLLLKQRSAEELGALAERVRRSLRSPIKLAGQDIVLTGSLGLAVYDGSQSDARDLLQEAETAVYRAKRGGSDRIEIFRPEWRGQSDERALLKDELARAIEKQQLRILYQPIVFMPMEELAGFQAIVRWDHPKLGLINPFGLFNEDAARALTFQLTQYTLMRALKACTVWQKELPREDKALFVNLSLPEDLALGQELAQEVRAALSGRALAKGSLKLGISQSGVMHNPELSAETLDWLRSAGAELVLDGFGSGYASLPYLGRLPFWAYRIDQSNLSGAAVSDVTRSDLLKGMTALIHELGRKVIVEGVESNDEASFLRSIDCEYGEGIYYGEPISERDVLQLLKLVRKSERRLQPKALFRTATRKRRPEDGNSVPSPAAGAPTAAKTGKIPAAAAASNGAERAHEGQRPPNDGRELAIGLSQSVVSPPDQLVAHMPSGRSLNGSLGHADGESRVRRHVRHVAVSPKGLATLLPRRAIAQEPPAFPVLPPEHGPADGHAPDVVPLDQDVRTMPPPVPPMAPPPMPLQLDSALPGSAMSLSAPAAPETPNAFPSDPRIAAPVTTAPFAFATPVPPTASSHQPPPPTPPPHVPMSGPERERAVEPPPLVQPVPHPMDHPATHSTVPDGRHASNGDVDFVVPMAPPPPAAAIGTATQKSTDPRYDKLPPAIAASLQRLAGTAPTRPLKITGTGNGSSGAGG